jgi:ClpP class serine protease
LAHLIREIKASKEIFAFTETLMGSAAMWIASACSGILATPSSKVGSIGAYLAFEDHTARNEAAGVKLLLFEAGKHKAIGLRPPTAEESAMLQDRVEAIHEDFKASILIERPSVKDSTMQGLVYSGIEAETLGLVDAVVMSFDEALQAIS